MFVKCSYQKYITTLSIFRWRIFILLICFITFMLLLCVMRQRTSASDYETDNSTYYFIFSLFLYFTRKNKHKTFHQYISSLSNYIKVYNPLRSPVDQYHDTLTIIPLHVTGN